MIQEKKESPTNIPSGQSQKLQKNAVVLVVKKIPKKVAANSKSPPKKIVKKIGIDLKFHRQRSQELLDYHHLQAADDEEGEVVKKKEKSSKKKKIIQNLQTEIIQPSKLGNQFLEKVPGILSNYNEKNMTPTQLKQKIQGSQQQNNGLQKVVLIAKNFHTMIKNSSSSDKRRNTINQQSFKINIQNSNIKESEQQNNQQHLHHHHHLTTRYDVQFIFIVLMPTLKFYQHYQSKAFINKFFFLQNNYQMPKNVLTIQIGNPQFYNTSFDRFQMNSQNVNQNLLFNQLQTNSPCQSNKKGNRSSNNSAINDQLQINQNNNSNQNLNNQQQQLQQQPQLPPPIKLRYFNIDNFLKNNANYFFDYQSMKRKVAIKQKLNHKKLRKLIKKTEKLNDSIQSKPRKNSVQINSKDTLGGGETPLLNTQNDQKSKILVDNQQKKCQENQMREKKQNEINNQDLILQLQYQQQQQQQQQQCQQQQQQQIQVVKERSSRYEQKLSKFQMRSSQKTVPDELEKGDDENEENGNDDDDIEDEEEEDEFKNKISLLIQDKTQKYLSIESANDNQQNFQNQQSNYTQQTSGEKLPTIHAIILSQETQKKKNQKDCNQEEAIQGQSKTIKFSENNFNKQNKIQIIGKGSHSPLIKRQKSPLLLKLQLSSERMGLNQHKEDNYKSHLLNNQSKQQPQMNSLSQINNAFCQIQRKNSLGKRKKQYSPQSEKIEAIQLKNFYLSHRNGLGQPKQYMAIFHFDGVLGRYDRPFFQKGEAYYDEDQQCYNAQSSKDMTIHELMLRYFWQRENLKIMFKSISQFYQVVIIFPEKNEIWDYVFNFFMHNKYNIDGIYYMQQSKTSYMNKPFYATDAPNQETLDQTTIDPQEPIKLSEITKFLVDYNVILNEFDIRNPKKILIFNSLDISSDEQFFTIKTPFQIMKEQHLQNQLHEKKINEEENKQENQHASRSADQHHNQNQINYYQNHPNSQQHHQKGEFILHQQQQLTKQNSNSNIFPQILSRKQTSNNISTKIINHPYDKSLKQSNKINSKNEEEQSNSSSLNSSQLSDSMHLNQQINSNLSNYPMLKQLIIDNNDYGKLFIGKFAKINVGQECLCFILVPSMYTKDRNNKYGAGTNCKILSEICIEFMQEGTQKNYLQKNRTQWGIINLKQEMYQSFKRKKKEEIVKQQHEKLLITCQEQKNNFQQIQKNNKWDEDDIISRLDFFFKERVFSIQAKFPNKINLEDLNLEELTLNIQDICQRNNKILKQLNAQSKLRKNQQYIQEDLENLKENTKTKNKNSSSLNSAIINNQLKDVKVATKYSDSFFICFESFKTFLLQICCFVFIL